ncbi:MAG: hypothetical protein RMZ41_031940 [Nostoc sp. DedVER02]|uniref:hypothetical protein n=1 Tax=unclassified Nostoc TaxID=2593658 RepID=UPI002AD3B83A|nr:MULTISPECIES: hypothetical protein [unclassified Nostoc]MDZ7986613.1 hypothetical protein [Nostoc sp. DedVER02]MDZ8116752.1 hypothetical protein [Nostoc sp. DedVER01b]
MLNSLISGFSTLARLFQANQQGIKYIMKTGGAGKKLYEKVIKPTILEEMGEEYGRLEIQKIGKTPLERIKIEKRQEWLLETGQAWKRKPY